MTKISCFTPFTETSKDMTRISRNFRSGSSQLLMIKEQDSSSNKRKVLFSHLSKRSTFGILLTILKAVTQTDGSSMPVEMRSYTSSEVAKELFAGTQTTKSLSLQSLPTMVLQLSKTAKFYKRS